MQLLRGEYVPKGRVGRIDHGRDTRDFYSDRLRLHFHLKIQSGRTTHPQRNVLLFQGGKPRGADRYCIGCGRKLRKLINSLIIGLCFTCETGGSITDSNGGAGNDPSLFGQ